MQTDVLRFPLYRGDRDTIFSQMEVQNQDFNSSLFHSLHFFCTRADSCCWGTLTYLQYVSVCSVFLKKISCTFLELPVALEREEGKGSSPHDDGLSLCGCLQQPREGCLSGLGLIKLCYGIRFCLPKPCPYIFLLYELTPSTYFSFAFHGGR